MPTAKKLNVYRLDMRAFRAAALGWSKLAQVSLPNLRDDDLDQLERLLSESIDFMTRMRSNVESEIRARERAKIAEFQSAGAQPVLGRFAAADLARRLDLEKYQEADRVQRADEADARRHKWLTSPQGQKWQASVEEIRRKLEARVFETEVHSKPLGEIWTNEFEQYRKNGLFEVSLFTQLQAHAIPDKPMKVKNYVSRSTLADMWEKAERDAGGPYAP